MAGKKRTVTRKSAEAKSAESKPENPPEPKKRAPTKAKRASARAGGSKLAGAGAGVNVVAAVPTAKPAEKAPSKTKAKVTETSNSKAVPAEVNGANGAKAVSPRPARRVSPSIAPTLTEETEFRQNGVASAPFVSQEAIATEAYFIWQAQGCPWGQDRQHWFAAESRLRRRS